MQVLQTISKNKQGTFIDKESSSGYIGVRVDLHCQADQLWNHLGDTCLDMSLTHFQKG